MADLVQMGIRLEAHGDRLRYSPRSAVTPNLANRMKAHKGELLAILRRDPDAPAIDLTNATAVWQAALGRLEGDPLFPPDVDADACASISVDRLRGGWRGTGPRRGETAGHALSTKDRCRFSYRCHQFRHPRVSLPTTDSAAAPEPTGKRPCLPDQPELRSEYH